MNAFLCFGDSITFGRGEMPATGWVGRLKKDFESQDPYNAVYNLGVPGENSQGLLSRIQTEASSRIKYLREGDHFRIIIAIGINDSRLINDSNEISLEQFKTNLQKIVAITKSLADKVFFVTCTSVDEHKTKSYEGAAYRNEQIQQYNQVIREVAENVIDVHGVLSDEHLGDGIHPNNQGYDLLYSYIKNYLS